MTWAFPWLVRNKGEITFEVFLTNAIKRPFPHYPGLTLLLGPFLIWRAGKCSEIMYSRIAGRESECLVKLWTGVGQMHAYGRSIKACSIISYFLVSADDGVVSRQVNRIWEVISISLAKCTLSHCCWVPVSDTSMACSQTQDILDLWSIWELRRRCSYPTCMGERSIN